jgi:TPR repeat protein
MRAYFRHAAAAMIAALSVQMTHDRVSLAQTPDQKPAADTPQQQQPSLDKPAQPPLEDLKPAFDALRAKDYAKAERILKPMAERNDPRAQFLLGAEVYGFVQSPLHNLAKAIPLLRESADRGFPRAMAVYGGALAEGAGVPRDKVEGYKFMALASRMNVPGVEAALAQLASEMTDEELERAKKAADAFVPRK